MWIESGDELIPTGRDRNGADFALNACAPNTWMQEEYSGAIHFKITSETCESDGLSRLKFVIIPPLVNRPPDGQ